MASLEESLALTQDEAVVLFSSLSTNGNNPALLKSLYAVDTTPERRRVVEISGEPGNYSARVVSDYNTVAHLGDEIRQMSDTLAGVKRVDTADDDDSPAEQSYLMQAWQALVMYIATCDDEDRVAAMQTLKMISNLMTDNDAPNQPATTGAFGLTAMAAAEVETCPQCNRTFASEAGLANHLKTVHAKKQAPTTESD